MDGPLKNLLVLDLTRVLVGPYCTMMLSDLGARVIKVEAPEVGDDSRKFGPFIEDYSAYFMSLNRGKESIALNLKNTDDKKIFDKILAKADILVENFKPGTLEKWGYGWKDICKKYPRLIYASASGFGQTGPLKELPAYDMVVQGMGGLMSVTGQPNSEPTRVGTSIGDITAGLFTTIGINAALYEFGLDAEVMVSSHNWPRWGNERIQEVMRTQRDAYANLNNQVLNLANQGVTINEIHNEYKVPPSLQKQWSARQYHGSEFHNSRAVINRYLGYWDGNPATLVPLSPADSAPLYVEMMGGSAKIIAKSNELFSEGSYRHAMELLNKLVYAEPTNTEAKDLLADVFEQLGYQYESASVRHVFLSSSEELRNGVKPFESPRGGSPTVARAMTTGQWWDAVATRVDSQAADEINFVLNFITPDTGQTFVVEMSGGTLSNIEGYSAPNPDATITMNRSDVETIIMGQATLGSQLQNGVGTVTGNAALLMQLNSVLVSFDPSFEVIPGTLNP